MATNLTKKRVADIETATVGIAATSVTIKNAVMMISVHNHHATNILYFDPNGNTATLDSIPVPPLSYVKIPVNMDRGQPISLIASAISTKATVAGYYRG